MFLRSLLGLFRRPSGSGIVTAGLRQPHRPFRTRLGCEPLEGRDLPSGVPTTLPFDGVDPAGHVAYVRRLYNEVLNRDVDGEGLRYWVNQLYAGATREDVVAGLWHSTEHAGLLVDDLYTTHFNRVVDDPGRDFW